MHIPYFAHEGWLVVKFLDNAISYGRCGDVVLFDVLGFRETGGLAQRACIV